jgi:excinuclease ABC subunit B
MKFAISETNRRRKIQDKYNKDNNITPQSIEKEIKDILTRSEEKTELPVNLENLEQKAMRYKTLTKAEKKVLVSSLETEMLIFADMLKFEEAARIRDILNDIKK